MSSLVHFFVAGGWVMYPLLVLSLLAFGVLFERLYTYSKLAPRAGHLLTDVVQECELGKFQEALQLCESREGPVPATLAAVIINRDRPVEDIERNVQEVGEGYFTQLERFLPILDTTTTVSPLLGLLGTLFGMIGTFQAIANSKDPSGRDNILSGVGEALYATATGLTIAIVCFIAYNYFAAKQRAIVLETEQSATALINVIRRHAQGVPPGREKAGTR